MITSESSALTERRVIVWVVRALSYLVYFYLIVVEIILFIGFFLLLFGANPSSGFVEWAYRNLERVMEPFRGIFTPIELGTNSGGVDAVFATSVVFAMIVYGIVALALNALITWLTGRLHQLEDAEAARDAEAALAAQQAAIATGATAPGTTATPTAGTVPTTGAAPTATPTAGTVPTTGAAPTSTPAAAPSGTPGAAPASSPPPPPQAP
jgi:type II secretory pathway pseudopilin PulG